MYHVNFNFNFNFNVNNIDINDNDNDNNNNGMDSYPQSVLSMCGARLSCTLGNAWCLYVTIVIRCARPPLTCSMGRHTFVNALSRLV